MKLEWGCPNDIATVQAAQLGGYDLLLGADVCYGQQALPLLFSTALQLLSPSPASLFLLSYVSRATANRS